MNDKPVLIIGSNGKTGIRVEQRLNTLGVPTRGVSRRTTPAFDWTDRSTWAGAIDGVGAMYVTYQPDLAIPEAEGDMQHLLALAKAEGVEHVILLSGRGEEGARNAEVVLETCGIDWNIIRASWFAQNFSESFMLGGILTGHLRLPAGEVPEPFIDIDDIADVAVAAFMEPGLRNRLFEVSGPEALTFAQCVATIARATGSEISYSEVPMPDFLAALAEDDVPAGIREALEFLFSEVLDGRNSVPATGVQEALGRPATDFATFAAKTAAAGAWHPETAAKVSV